MKKNCEALDGYKKRFSDYLTKEVKSSGLSMVRFCKQYGLSACSMSHFIAGDMLPSFPTLHQLSLIRHQGRLTQFLSEVLGEENDPQDLRGAMAQWSDPQVLQPENILPEERFKRQEPSEVLVALDTWLDTHQHLEPSVLDMVKRRYAYRRISLDYEVPEEPPEGFADRKNFLVIPKNFRELALLDPPLYFYIENYLCGFELPVFPSKKSGVPASLQFCFKNIWSECFKKWGLYDLPRVPRQNVWIGKRAWISCFRSKIQKSESIVFGNLETLEGVPPEAVEHLTKTLRTFSYEMKFSYLPQKGGSQVSICSAFIIDS